MKYYVIKKDGLYFDDIMSGFTSFTPIGCIFIPKHIDLVWWKYLSPKDRLSATIHEVIVKETGGTYTPDEKVAEAWYAEREQIVDEIMQESNNG